MWLIGTTYGTYDLTNKEIRYLFIGQSPYFVLSLLQHVASTLTHFI